VSSLDLVLRRVRTALARRHVDILPAGQLVLLTRCPLPGVNLRCPPAIHLFAFV
jgi:hypothetical protein